MSPARIPAVAQLVPVPVTLVDPAPTEMVPVE